MFLLKERERQFPTSYSKGHQFITQIRCNTKIQTQTHKFKSTNNVSQSTLFIDPHAKPSLLLRRSSITLHLTLQYHYNITYRQMLMSLQETKSSKGNVKKEYRKEDEGKESGAAYLEQSVEGLIL